MSYGREFLKNVLVYCYPDGLDQKSIQNSLSRIFVSKSFNNRMPNIFFIARWHHHLQFCWTIFVAMSETHVAHMLRLICLLVLKFPMWYWCCWPDHYIYSFILLFCMSMTTDVPWNMYGGQKTLWKESDLPFCHLCLSGKIQVIRLDGMHLWAQSYLVIHDQWIKCCIEWV